MSLSSRFLPQSKTPAMVLQELCVKNKNLGIPQYHMTPETVAGTHMNTFEYEVVLAGGISAIGVGSSKQIAKHEAALRALMTLKELGLYDPVSDPVAKFKDVALSPTLSTTVQATQNNSDMKVTPNCIMPLRDICLAHKIPEPVFTAMAEVGPPHNRKFTFECRLVSTSLVTVATSSTKKLAKQLAAQEMLEKVKNILPEVQILMEESSPVAMKAIELPTINENTLAKYNQLYGCVVPDKTVPIADFCDVFKKYMKINEKSLEDFMYDLSVPGEEPFEKILAQLNLKHHFYMIQLDPYMSGLVVTTDTPFTFIGLSFESEEEAKLKALMDAFVTMKNWMI